MPIAEYGPDLITNAQSVDTQSLNSVFRFYLNDEWEGFDLMVDMHNEEITFEDAFASVQSKGYLKDLAELVLFVQETIPVLYNEQGLYPKQATGLNYFLDKYSSLPHLDTLGYEGLGEELIPSSDLRTLARSNTKHIFATLVDELWDASLHPERLASCPACKRIFSKEARRSAEQIYCSRRCENRLNTRKRREEKRNNFVAV